MEQQKRTPLIITDKMLDCIQYALRYTTYVMAFEGSIRSIKTTTVIQMLHFLVQQSDEIFHLISAQDNSSINEVLLRSEVGLLTLYPEFYQMKKDQIGGYYIEVKCDVIGKPSIKKILLCGFGNKARWKAINGHQFGVILLDEANNSDKQFLDECFARQANVNHPKMLFTLNGDSPTHFIYQDYINFCKILGKAPASIIADMSQQRNKEGYYYVHFTMYDNPTMTEEKIKRTMDIYPMGSYYYKIKILGERGTSGKLIYNEYMEPKKHLKMHFLNEFNEFVVGCDIGATKAKNSLALVGYNRDKTKVAILDKYTFKQCGYDSKRKIMLAIVKNWVSMGYPIKVMCVDSAEQNFIIDLKSAFKEEGIFVVSSYKATIKQRIDMMIILLALGIISFNNTKEGNDAYNAYLMAKWAEGKEGQEREDKNEEINDIMDSIEYALTFHMKELMHKANQAINQGEVI